MHLCIIRSELDLNALFVKQMNFLNSFNIKTKQKTNERKKKAQELMEIPLSNNISELPHSVTCAFHAVRTCITVDRDIPMSSPVTSHCLSQRLVCFTSRRQENISIQTRKILFVCVPSENSKYLYVSEVDLFRTLQIYKV